MPYAEVLFLDGSTPSVAVVSTILHAATSLICFQLAQPGQPARPALPVLGDIDAIRNLTALQAGRYLTGHGVPLPQGTPARRSRVAQCVGCIIDIWCVPTILAISNFQLMASPFSTEHYFITSAPLKVVPPKVAHMYFMTFIFYIEADSLITLSYLSLPGPIV